MLESSHVPLQKWVLAYRLMNSSKNGVSAHQLHQNHWRYIQNGVVHGAPNSESMRQDDLAPMGGSGSIVEIDETFIGRKPDMEAKRGTNRKHVVLTLVERALPF